MLHINTIISPTDFSTPSLESLRTCIAIAEECNSEIILAHVVKAPAWIGLSYTRQGLEPYQVRKVLREQGKEALQKITQLQSTFIPKHIRSRIILQEGSPADKLVHIAKEQSADLIVMASKGHSGWHRFLFGSFADQVVRSATCPVLMVSPNPQSAIPNKNRNAVFINGVFSLSGLTM